MNRRGEQKTYKNKRGKRSPCFKYLNTVSTPTIISAVTYGKISMKFKELKDSEFRKYEKEQKSIHSLSKPVCSVASQLVKNPVSLFFFTSHKHKCHRIKAMNKENFTQETKATNNSNCDIQRTQVIMEYSGGKNRGDC